MNGLSKYPQSSRSRWATAIGWCAAALAYSFAMPLVQAAEELNIKGVTIGMSEQKLHELLGEPYRCWQSAGATLGERVCGKPGTMADTYAGMHVEIMRLVKDGKVITVYVDGLKPDDFTSLEKPLIEKFGEPIKKERGEVHNAMGATFDEATDTWTSGDAMLRLKKRCTKVTDSCLTLSSLQYMQDELKAQENKARSDM